MTAADSLLSTIRGRFGTILADPPWRFLNSTGKVAPEHKRLARYSTMTLQEINELPVALFARDTAHLYLWVPNALLPDGLAVMAAWAFTTKRISCGIKFGRMAAPMAVESAFTSEI